MGMCPSRLAPPSSMPSNISLTLVHYHTCFRHHRKPYLTIGALVFSAAFLSYALSSIDHIVWLAVCVFVGTMGLICMDVMADTMCVERAKFESEEIRGHTCRPLVIRYDSVALYWARY